MQPLWPAVILDGSLSVVSWSSVRLKLFASSMSGVILVELVSAVTSPLLDFLSVARPENVDKSSPMFPEQFIDACELTDMSVVFPWQTLSTTLLVGELLLTSIRMPTAPEPPIP